MNRREFVAAAAAGRRLSGETPRPVKGYIELRLFRLRNSRTDQVRRTTDYLANGVVPVAGKASVGPVGVFTGVIASDNPFILTVIGFPTMAAVETWHEKLAADRDYQKAAEVYNAGSEPGFVRIEVSLLRAFASMPGIEIPPLSPQRPPRIFELRTYESQTTATLQRKIKMFDDAEIAIFRRCGLLPVFFGETIIGRNMPNLTYMVAFDDIAAREKAWNTFRSDPEWLKLRSRPELADAEIVSNITNAILRPLPFSSIR
jgi:hypothetical protein